MINKRTKVVCTIGPASEKQTTLTKMISAGMNVARLNFSHGTHAGHRKLIKNIRAAAKATDQPVALLADLQGPRIRLGDLPKTGVKIKKKSKVILTTGKPSKGSLLVTYANLHKDVKVGDPILIADGAFELKVEKIVKNNIHCQVITGGTLTSHKGINLPKTTVKLPIITDKDKKDLKFGLQQNVDWVVLSFVMEASNIKDLRKLIRRYEKELGLDKKSPVKIMAKIEKHEGIKNFDAILEEVDGVMIGRGDLGIETPAEEVPLLQKQIVDKCLGAAKPVIVATQMLESMIKNPRPTRAEVSDVANAVIDHTDAVMLSGETASGNYPVEAVTTMTKVVAKTEGSIYDDLPLEKRHAMLVASSTSSISEAASLLAEAIDAKLILVASLSGETARAIARYRPQLPIVVATSNKRVMRQLLMSWGLRPFVISQTTTRKELIKKGVKYIQKNKLTKKGDKVVVVSGPVKAKGGIDTVAVKTV